MGVNLTCRAFIIKSKSLVSLHQNRKIENLAGPGSWTWLPCQCSLAPVPTAGQGCPSAPQSLSQSCPRLALQGTPQPWAQQPLTPLPSRGPGEPKTCSGHRASGQAEAGSRGAAPRWVDTQALRGGVLPTTPRHPPRSALTRCCRSSLACMSQPVRSKAQPQRPPSGAVN